MKARRFLSSLLAGVVVSTLVLSAGVAGAAEAPPPRGGGLPSYVPGWNVPAGDLIGFAFDAQDRPWLLAKDQAAFVRLDEQGKAVERIPFAWPADLDRNNRVDCSFAVSEEDFVVGHYRFDRSGKVVALYPFQQSRFLAAGPDGTVVRLMEGLEIYDAKGKLLRRFSEGGLAPGKIDIAVGLAVDRRGRIIVAERWRLQTFDRQGKLVRAVDLPAELRAQGILGLAMDGDGYLYAPLPQPAGTVVVFDPELRYLGSVRIGGNGFFWSLTADRQGRLYSLVTSPSRQVVQMVPAAGSVRLAQPLTTAGGGELPRELPQVRSTREVRVVVSAEERAALPFRLHASTRGVLDVAADPLVAGRLWLGTEGGLVRFDAGSGAWRRWTIADGLPEAAVRSVFSDGRRVYLAMDDSAAVFDVERERFRSFTLRHEDLHPFLGAVRVAAAPDAPGVFWWIVRRGAVRQEVSADGAGGGADGTWSFFPLPGNAPVVDGLVLAGGRIVVLSQRELWELAPAAQEWRRVSDIDVLDRAAPQRRNAGLQLDLRALSTDDGGRTFWVGTGEGIFHVAADGRATWPEEARDPRCNLQRVVRQGERRFAYGNGCLREIGRPGCCAVDPERVEEILQAIPDPSRPGLLWLATRSGLATFRPADGQLAVQRPAWPEPDGVRVTALLAAEGRIWISQRDGGVGALDPAAQSWTTFPRLRQVQVLRRSAANGNLLVYGYGRGGRVLTWIDPKTAEAVLVPGKWEEDPWGGVDDFHHDAQGLWVTGRLRRSEGGRGFGVQRADGTSQIFLQGQFPGGPNSLLPDPAHPGDFLLVGEEHTLVRLHTATGVAETLRAKVSQIRLSDERYVWIEGEPNARLDLQTGALATLDLDGRIFPDPGHPDRVWLLRYNVLALCDIATGTRLAEITLPEGEAYEEVAVSGDRLWIGSSIGLLEVLRPG